MAAPRGARGPRAAVIVLAALALVVAGAATSSAAPTGPAGGATGPLVRVTLQLARPNAAAIKALGAEKGISRSARLDRLHALLPSAAVRAQVGSVARAQGLTVLTTTPVSLVVTAPASRVRALFGDPPAAVPGARAGGLHVPAAFGGLVAQVVGGTTGHLAEPRFNPTPLTGPQAAAIYHAPLAPPAGGSVQTIATIELSGWDSSALSEYAVEHGEPLGDPVASGQYSEVSVDGADPSAPDGNNGDIEVAIDQEAIIGTDPYAHQRAYFAPNVGGQGGFLDALNQVATDAMSTSPNAHLTALSISWGACEDLQFSSSLDAFESSISTLEAAGVTVFVATADRGAYDCSVPGTVTSDNTYLSVDFPASSPSAIGVGGTSVDHVTTPASPAERVWWDSAFPSGPDDFQGYGTGGGYSHYFTQPAYQAGRISSGVRTLPDIALDGDPASGLAITRYDQGSLQHLQYGGTSLAAPFAAATYTDLLASKGYSGGLGDIHDALYHAPAGALRDVTVGTNGFYGAGTGYDLASGLGAPLWAQLATTVLPLLSVTAPAYIDTAQVPVTVSAPAGAGFAHWAAGSGALPTDCSTATSTVVPTQVTTSGEGTQTIWVLGATSTNCYLATTDVLVDTVPPVAAANAPPGSPGTFTWSATDAAPSSGPGSYSVTVTHASGTVVDYSASTTTTSFVADGLPGTTYAISVVAHDRAGNASAPATATLTILPSTYVPVAPCRVFDTRGTPGGCAGAPLVAHAAVGTGQVLRVPVTGVGGVPSNATAVVLNVTAVGATTGTYVTVYPDGTTRPTVSNLNVTSAAAVPNLVVVRLRDGAVDFYNRAGSVHLLADLAGYYSPGSGSSYTPVGPCRVFDTRHGAGSCTQAPVIPVAQVGAGGILSVPITDVAGVPADATAVVLNVTAVGATRGTYVSVYPDGGARPVVSNLNVNSVRAVPNLVVVAVTDGRIDFYNNAGSVDLLADLAGYYGPSGGSTFAPMNPCRVFDTRSGAGACPGSPVIAKAALKAGGVLAVPITGVAGVPADATAVILNVTAVGGTSGTYISVYPHGGVRPGVSNLNVSSSAPVPNLVIVPITDGTIDFYNNTGSVELIADLAGFYAP